MATHIKVECATNCGASDRVPAYEDKNEKDPAKRDKPVQPHPYVCLACWRAGWRSEAPVGDKEPWRIYQLPGHPQVLKPNEERV